MKARKASENQHHDYNMTILIGMENANRLHLQCDLIFCEFGKVVSND